MESQFSELQKRITRAEDEQIRVSEATNKAEALMQQAVKELRSFVDMQLSQGSEALHRRVDEERAIRQGDVSALRTATNAQGEICRRLDEERNERQTSMAEFRVSIAALKDQLSQNTRISDELAESFQALAATSGKASQAEIYRLLDEERVERHKDMVDLRASIAFLEGKMSQSTWTSDDLAESVREIAATNAQVELCRRIDEERLERQGEIAAFRVSLAAMKDELTQVTRTSDALADSERLERQTSMTELLVELAALKDRMSQSTQTTNGIADSLETLRTKCFQDGLDRGRSHSELQSRVEKLQTSLSTIEASCLNRISEEVAQQITCSSKDSGAAEVAASVSAAEVDTLLHDNFMQFAAEVSALETRLKQDLEVACQDIPKLQHELERSVATWTAKNESLRSDLFALSQEQALRSRHPCHLDDVSIGRTELDGVRKELEDLRAEWREAIDEERQHSAAHARTLGRALGEEFERNAVARAVNEAKVAAMVCLASDEEKRSAELTEFKKRLTELEVQLRSQASDSSLSRELVESLKSSVNTQADAESQEILTRLLRLEQQVADIGLVVEKRGADSEYFHSMLQRDVDTLQERLQMECNEWREKARKMSDSLEDGLRGLIQKVDISLSTAEVSSLISPPANHRAMPEESAASGQKSPSRVIEAALEANETVALYKQFGDWHRKSSPDNVQTEQPSLGSVGLASPSWTPLPPEGRKQLVETTDVAKSLPQSQGSLRPSRQQKMAPEPAILPSEDLLIPSENSERSTAPSRSSRSRSPEAASGFLTALEALREENMNLRAANLDMREEKLRAQEEALGYNSTAGTTASASFQHTHSLHHSSSTPSTLLSATQRSQNWPHPAPMQEVMSPGATAAMRPGRDANTSAVAAARSVSPAPQLSENGAHQQQQPSRASGSSLPDWKSANSSSMMQSASSSSILTTASNPSMMRVSPSNATRCVSPQPANPYGQPMSQQAKRITSPSAPTTGFRGTTASVPRSGPSAASKRVLSQASNASGGSCASSTITARSTLSSSRTTTQVLQSPSLRGRR